MFSAHRCLRLFNFLGRAEDCLGWASRRWVIEDVHVTMTLFFIYHLEVNLAFFFAGVIMAHCWDTKTATMAQGKLT